jgi:hypothetical protein
MINIGTVQAADGPTAVAVALAVVPDALTPCYLAGWTKLRAHDLRGRRNDLSNVCNRAKVQLDFLRGFELNRCRIAREELSIDVGAQNI